METEKARNGNSILYGIARGFAWLMLRVLMPVRYHGKEKLSGLKGSFVLISNRSSAFFWGKRNWGKTRSRRRS